jgi:hypothetical protein
MRYDTTVNIRLSQGLANALSLVARSRRQSKAEVLRGILQDALMGQPSCDVQPDRIAA